jgi:uncharacterized protein YjbI with pentapeptide repeats
MLLQSARFDREEKPPHGWEDAVLRYCDFCGLDFDGRGLEGMLLGCTFEGCSWYWSLFNTATLVGVEFKHCEFSGVNFAGCRFVECTFEGCRFTHDSFGKPCSFSENRWYACDFVETVMPEGIDLKAPT